MVGDDCGSFHNSPSLNRKVVAYYNIKPCKMAGEASEAMVLAGVVDNKGPNEQVEVLDFEHPEAVNVGDKITIEGVLDPIGQESEGVSLKNISKQWAKAQPHFTVKDRAGYLLDKFPWGVRVDGKFVRVVVKGLKKGGIC